MKRVLVKKVFVKSVVNKGVVVMKVVIKKVLLKVKFSEFKIVGKDGEVFVLLSFSVKGWL